MQNSVYCTVQKKPRIFMVSYDDAEKLTLTEAIQIIRALLKANTVDTVNQIRHEYISRLEEDYSSLKKELSEEQEKTKSLTDRLNVYEENATEMIKRIEVLKFEISELKRR